MIIEETLYNKIPNDLQALFIELPNIHKEEVLQHFPDTKSGLMKKGTNRLMSSNPNKNTYGHFDPDQVENDTYGDSGSASRFFYCSKPSPAERNLGCENLEKKPSGMISNTSGQHITRRDGGAPSPKGNNHPTVKSIKLMSYLCKLITPPKGTILDPFMGSGSTGIAAKVNSFSFIGIEKDEHYFQIAKARIQSSLKTKTASKTPKLINPPKGLFF